MRTVPDVATAQQALVTGTVIDVTTGAPVRADYRVATDRPALVPRAVSGGRYCVSGRDDDLAPQVTLTVAVAARGYRDGAREVAVPAQPAYPLEGRDVELTPLPVILQGRVTTATHAAVEDARVDVHVAGAQVVALRRPVARAFPKGAEVRGVTVPAGAHGTTLRAAAVRGVSTLALKARGALAAGAELALGWPDPLEAVRVQALGPGPDDVQLAAPLGGYHAAGAAVQEVAVGAVVTTLDRACHGGEGLVFLTAAFAGETLELRDPAGAREQRFGGALTDARGYFLLAGVTGVSDVGVTATPPGGVAKPPVPVTVDYSLPMNVVDLPAA